MDRKNPDNNNCASSSLVSKYDVIVPSAGEIIVIPRNPVPIIEANNQSVTSADLALSQWLNLVDVCAWFQWCLCFYLGFLI